jgi:hypothetical protein
MPKLLDPIHHAIVRQHVQPLDFAALTTDVPATPERIFFHALAMRDALEPWADKLRDGGTPIVRTGTPEGDAYYALDQIMRTADRTVTLADKEALRVQGLDNIPTPAWLQTVRNLAGQGNSKS